MIGYNLQDTIVALATPSGEGAIGVIRLSGSDAIDIADIVFYGKKLKNQASHTLHFGTIRDEHNVVLDEVLVAIFKAPRSYTKENIVEISCHGSSYILQSVLQLLLRQGARLAKPGEFTLRAFLNGAMDLSQAEAVADLIASDSKAAHEVAMKQMRGGFSEEIKALRQELIDFAALVELELDFGEEDVEFADRQKLKDLILKIQATLKALSDSFLLGNVIKNGVTTVIAGRPNAGKSTLLNALLNEERAIVSEIAGTTRDVIEEVLNIKGVAFRLVDTAGIREATDTIEAMGIKRTLEKVSQSAILVYVYDSIDLDSVEVKADLEKLYKEGMQVVIVPNKSDILHEMKTHQQSHHLKEECKKFTSKDEKRVYEAFLERGFRVVDNVSAKKHYNIDTLKETLYDLAIGKKLQGEQTIITNSRHATALENARAALGDVLSGLELGVTGDFLAQDIRFALRYLGSITGEIESDDLLASIFSRFCIGK